MHRNIFGFIVITLLLTGCVSPSLTGKTADEVGMAALQKSLGEPSYNFTVKMQMSLITAPVNSIQQPDEDEEDDDFSPTSSIGNFLETLFKGITIDFQGAVDVPKQHGELEAVINYNQRNIQSSLTVPIILEGPAPVKVLIDPSAFSLFLSELAKSEVNGKFVQLPTSITKSIGNPFSPELLTEVKTIYSEMDKNVFSFQPLNQQDHQWGASRKVRLSLKPAQISALSCQLGSMKIVYQTLNLKNVDKDACTAKLTDLLSELVGADNIMNFDMSLQDSHVVGYAIHTAVSAKNVTPISHGKQFLQLNMTSHFTNFGHPKFKYQPDEKNIVQINHDTLPTLAEILDINEDENASISESITDDEECSAPDETEKPQEKPAKKNKSEAKAKRKSPRKR